MAGFGSPITPGYGLGQIGAGISEGLLKGQQEAPILQRENLQNQQLGMEVQGEQAANSALSQPAAGEVPQDQQLTPYDNQIARLNAAASQLEQSGQGLQAAKLRQQALGFAQQQHLQVIKSAAQTLLSANPNAAIPLIKAAGWGEPKSIQRDDQGNLAITGQDGHVAVMTPQQVVNAFENPEQAAQNMMMTAYYGQRIGVANRGLDIKENQNQVGNALRQLSINQRDTASQRALQARLGAANISAATRKYIFDNAPVQQAFLHMTGDPTQGGLGMTEDQALSSIDQLHMSQANPAVQQQQLLQTYLKNNPGATLQEGLNWAASQPVPGSPAPTSPRVARNKPKPQADPGAAYRARIGQPSGMKPGKYTAANGVVMNVGPDGTIAGFENIPSK